MVRYETIVFCVCLAAKLSEVPVSGFRFDDPCDVRPRYKGGIPDSTNFTTEVQVPTSCRNGTFIWSYPRGNALVKFNNKRRIPTSICIRNSLVGEIFTIIDTTDNEVVGPLDYERWVCTSTTNKTVIILRVVAPEEMRYMGGFKYKLRR